MRCYACGSREFTLKPVLWPKLIEEWSLSSYETEYVESQQGYCCLQCDNNLRSNTLAKSFLMSIGDKTNLRDASKKWKYRKLNILEINTAGLLTKYLAGFRNHQLIEYPSHDIQDLRTIGSEWDFVIHSDTLEHVPDFKKALSECYRILKPSGKLIFTTPIIIDRSTKSRQGLPLSYHGNPMEFNNEMLVHWEFGVDIWKHLGEIGFNQIEFTFLNFPAGIAISATR